MSQALPPERGPTGRLRPLVDGQGGVSQGADAARSGINPLLEPYTEILTPSRDIVGLYLSPPDNAVVFSVDEKSQIQALARATPVLPMDLGMPERRTHNYLRHGTTDLFAALDVATGQVLGRCFNRHRALEFLKFLKGIDEHVNPELDVHVILDNLSTHKTPAVMRWLVRHPRFHLHFTPTHASWLNMVERFFGLLTQQALQRGSHNSVRELREAITGFIDAHNETPRPFRWTKTADEILDSMRRFASRTLTAHAHEKR
jgi:transposase